MIKTLKINGTQINDNSCTSMTVRVLCKEFDAFIYSSFHKANDNDVTINQIAVMKWVNQAESVKVEAGEKKNDENLYLILETEIYKIVVIVPKGDD